MDSDENKERTTPGEREEVRPTGSGGERTEGRASRPDRGSTRGTSGAVAAATGAARSLLRLTPAGDAARMWLPTAVASLVLAFVFFAAGGPFRSVHWLLGINVSYGLILVLTWGAMWLSTPADVSAKGAEFLTEPIDRGPEIRCYMRDLDGYLIEVGQSTRLLDREDII